MAGGHRVVVTGMGIVSCLGNTLNEVSAALRAGRSGVRFNPQFAELGFDSLIAALPHFDPDTHIERKRRRFMGACAAYAYVSACAAVADAGLTRENLHNERTGVIAGSGTGSGTALEESATTMKTKGLRRVSPYLVPKQMGSTVSANLTTALGCKGISYSISSACATGAHCIGAAYEQIALGKQDVMIAGGAEEELWAYTAMFDAMGALSKHRNETPETACRPYDIDRDGFVIAAGGGILVLESLDHARARGARIYGEIIGYAANSDGTDMVSPSGEGGERCMRMALRDVNESVDYINTHGTGTPVGDIVELHAIRKVFGEKIPLLSSTKGLTGHPLGAAAAHEAIYTLLMMRDNFIAASANIMTLDPGAEGFPLVRETLHEHRINVAMSNSFGFGGSNACLVFRRMVD